MGDLKNPLDKTKKTTSTLGTALLSVDVLFLVGNKGALIFGHDWEWWLLIICMPPQDEDVSKFHLKIQDRKK